MQIQKLNEKDKKIFKKGLKVLLGDFLLICWVMGAFSLSISFKTSLPLTISAIICLAIAIVCAFVLTESDKHHALDMTDQALKYMFLAIVFVILIFVGFLFGI